MRVLTFDPAGHIYRLDGVIIPGYSQIAQKEGVTDYDGVPDYLLESARQFGTAGHHATRLYDEDRLDDTSLSLPLVPCLNQYQEALIENKIEILQEFIEQPICSYLYRYGVTPDRICLVKGELSVLELKFVETMQPGTKLQTAAQKIAAQEYYKIKIKNRYALQIRVNDKAKIHKFNDRSDEDSWRCFLGAFNWRIKNGK